MNREMLMLVDALSMEKNVAKNIVFGALEMALASATKKKTKDEIQHLFLSMKLVTELLFISLRIKHLS